MLSSPKEPVTKGNCREFFPLSRVLSHLISIISHILCFDLFMFEREENSETLNDETTINLIIVMVR